MHLFLKFILLSAFLSNYCFAQSFSHPLIPEKSKLLIIGQQKDAIDDYIENIGSVPGGFMFYTSLVNLEGLDKPADNGAGINDVHYYITHYPHTVIQLGLYMVGAIDDTLQGKYDDNILRLARWMKSVKNPIYLRIGYEFDLPNNGYDPLKYQQAYRYIVDRLRSIGVENADYVWHSASLIESSGNFMDWYPGDDYVDWFAVSLFNPMQIATAKKFFSIARQHQKPLMIAESTPTGEISSDGKMEWFRHYFDFINNENVKIVSYINSNWNTYPLFQTMNWGDARIQSDPSIKRMWIKETQSGYLRSSAHLF